jgi:hypothetical protein
MIETDYKAALAVATDAEAGYVAAVRSNETRHELAELAMSARDRWSAVATVCALGEDGARSRIDAPPMRHRHQALHNAWLTRRNWAACGEDASARAELIGALMTAHGGRPAPRREGLRLIADG